MSSPSASAARLAAAVKSRRADLALNQLDVARAGGPSNTTLTEIENGRVETLTQVTAKKLDKGLQWKPGSAMSVWRDGAEPVELDKTVGADTQDASGSETDFVEAPGARVDSGISNEDLLREILRSRAEYDQLRAEVRDLRGDVAGLLDLPARVGRLEQSP